MEFEENYNPLGMQIEGNIRKQYEDAFENLKKTNSYIEDLELIANMFEALGKSKPSRGKGIEWAGDLIPVYRNLGKIIKQISPNLSDRKTEEDWEYLENLGKLLREYGDGTEEELEEALKVKNLLHEYKIKKEEIEKLFRFENVLEKYDIEYADELEELLQNQKNLQNNLQSLENSLD